MKKLKDYLTTESYKNDWWDNDEIDHKDLLKFAKNACDKSKMTPEDILDDLEHTEYGEYDKCKKYKKWEKEFIKLIKNDYDVDAILDDLYMHSGELFKEL